MGKLFFVKLVLFVATLFASVSLLAANQITATRVWPADAYTRVTIEAESPLKYQTFTLKNPERLVVDVEDITLNDVLNSLSNKIQADDPYIENKNCG